MDIDDERISKKAHELWESEGRPHGRDREHWDAAKEIIALEESGGVPRLPRNTGVDEPVEEKSAAIDNEGEFPNLTDTGEHDLTDTSREPAVTAPSAASKKSAARTVPAKSAAAPQKASASKAAAKPEAVAATAGPSDAATPKGKSKAR